jgi:hypothetical protein
MSEMTEAERQAYEVSLFASTHPGEIYGIHWGDPDVEARLKPVLENFMRPELEKRRRLCEIGSGAGRWSRYMRTEVTFLVSPTGTVPVTHFGKYDYVFSFDTFVHFDLPLFLQYLRTISKMLLPGGVLHLHYADLQQSDWFKRLESEDLWAAPCRSFRYVGREDLSALLYKFNLHRTDRELTFIANGSRFIECIKGPNG